MANSDHLSEKCGMNTVLRVFWVLTVVSAFTGSCLLSVSFPVIGTLFPFRVFLPLTALFTLIACIRNRENPWKDASLLEKSCAVFALSLFLYGCVSLFRAVDFTHTFHRFFNLIFDMVFFLLLLYYMKKPSFRKLTVILCYVLLFTLSLVAFYEIYNGGIFFDKYDTYKRLFMMDRLCQWPTLTFANCNDLAMALVFLLSILASDLYLSPTVTRGKTILFSLASALVYFHTVSTTSRLSRYSFFILMAALLLIFLLRKPRFFVLPVLLITAILATQFVTQYHKVIRPYYEYRVALRAYESAGGTGADAPVLDIKSEESLMEQFINADEEGNTVLRNDTSAGWRMHLLLHAFRCFKESYALGVGLGNTEMLARDRMVTGDAGIYATHCFLVRLIADCGIFALLPLVFIVLLLIQKIVAIFKAKNRRAAVCGILLSAMLILYPVLSTASSDAQDSAAMWMFLAFLVTLAVENVPKKTQE